MAVPEDLSSWMGSLKDDIKLNKVVFPATHDSGMSFQSLAHSFPDVFNPLAGLTTVVTGALAIADDVRPKFLGGSKREHIKIFHDNFVTQGVKVGGQLAFGARQFDLRVTSHLGQLVTYHGHWAQSIIGMRRYGESWKSICKSIAEFMAANPTEFLVLKMDKQKPGKIFKKTELKKLIKTLTKALEKAGVKNHKKGELLNYWVDQATIKELRGRILLCFAVHASPLSLWAKIGYGSLGCSSHSFIHALAGIIPIDKRVKTVALRAKGSKPSWSSFVGVVVNGEGQLRSAAVFRPQIHP